MNRLRIIAFLAAISIVSGFVLPSNAARAVSSRCTTEFGVIGRRNILESIVVYTCGIILAWPSAVAGAKEETMPPSTTKPYATLDALLPAARVKLTIDESVTITSELVSLDSNSNKKEQLIQELQDLLLKPQNYTRASTLADVPQRPARQYLDTYKKNLDRLNILEKPGGMLVQSGEIDTWKRLKRQERAREKNDEIRAAFNTYTTNLSFSGDSYRLNVPKDERSRMIRDDALPDVKSVIASDMGMRYLYRNEVLTNMEDARAELQYQIGQGDGSFDATDLLEILRQAQSSCNKWFSLIDDSDVQNAMQEAKQEEKQTQ